MPYALPKIHPLYIALLVSLFFLVPGNIIGQATGDPREDFLYGEYYISMGQYQKALPFFISALASNPENCNLNYRTGFCYLRLIGQQDKALPYLEKAVKEINDHYVEGKFKETASPPESLLLLGEAYHRENRLTEASKAYHTYKDLIADNDKKMLEVVMKRISGLGISYEFQREDKKAEMINMGGEINSRFSDYNPVLNGNQDVMLYTQYWESYDRIMLTRKVNGAWTAPQEINDEIGSYGNCYTSALSFDGSVLYLVRYDDFDYNIVYSELKNGVWTKIKELPGKVNSRYRETSITISGDGSTVYFASDQPGGEGGFDIYKAEFIGGEWTDVENLGVGINTEKNEEAPYISYDGVNLFFSSGGHETIGNLDVLFTEIDAQGNWSRPINVGSPINTTNDDLFYIYFKDTKTGYLSRDFPDGHGRNDIYMIKGAADFSSNKNQQPAFTDPALKKNSQSLSSNDKVYNEVDTESTTGVQKSNTMDVPFSNTEISDENRDTDKPDYAVNSGGSHESSFTTHEHDKPDVDAGIVKGPQAPLNSSVTKNEELNSGTTPAIAQISTSQSNYSREEYPRDSPVVMEEPGQKLLVTNEQVSDLLDNESKYQANAVERTVDDNYNIIDREAYDSDNTKEEGVGIQPVSYTIQIYALKKQLHPGKIALSPLEISVGSDGLVRYTYGEYDTEVNAMKVLRRIIKMGYDDAFIRKTNTISNYKSGLL